MENCFAAHVIHFCLSTDSRRLGLSLRYNFGIKPKENKMDMLEQGNTERN